MIASIDVERRHDAGVAIVLEAEFAIICARIAPGDHEDGEALRDEIADERILRRQIENIIFHDPSRNEKDRLAVHLFRLRRILDELDQTVAIDDLARRHGDIAARFEVFRAGWLQAAHLALEIIDEVQGTTDEIGAARLDDAMLHDRIGRNEIRRRHHVEHLPHGELDDIFMLRRDTGDSGRRIVPPLLLQQEALPDEREWPSIPFRGGKALVLRQGLDAMAAVRAGQCRCREIGEAHPFAERFAGQLHLLAGRDGEMNAPIGEGAIECHGRQAAGDFGERGMKGVIEPRAGAVERVEALHRRFVGRFVGNDGGRVERECHQPSPRTRFGMFIGLLGRKRCLFWTRRVLVDGNVWHGILPEWRAHIAVSGSCADDMDQRLSMAVTALGCDCTWLAVWHCLRPHERYFAGR